MLSTNLYFKKTKIQYCKTTQLIINYNNIIRLNIVKYLGMMIDSKITFSAHVFEF